MPTREEMHNLAREIISSYESRVEGVSQIRQGTHTQIRELDRAHNAMGQELRAELNQAGTARRQDEAQRTRERGQVVTQRKSHVRGQLQELDRAHHAMARQQRAYLARGRAGLTGQVNTLRADLARGRAALTAEVRAWIGQVATEHAGARQEWQRLVATMGAKRNGAAAVGAVAEDLATLSDRIFQYLANHPDGARLTEIEREFGLGRLQAGRVVRHLMDEGKAEKRSLSYFAT